MKRILATIIIAYTFGGLGGNTKAAEEKSPTTRPAQDQAALEKQFAQTMTNAVLVGHFNVDGDNRAPREDRYTIARVQKQQGETWIFFAKFGKQDVVLPIALQVKWAGDTPVITLTDFTIPGHGTYTARVLIYRDHYAGTWSAPMHGGTMWGQIEHAKNGEGTEK